MFKIRALRNPFKRFHLRGIMYDVTIHDDAAIPVVFRSVFKIFRYIMEKTVHDCRYHYVEELHFRQAIKYVSTNKLCVNIPITVKR